jgi:hypothetical protein
MMARAETDTLAIRRLSLANNNAWTQKPPFRSRLCQRRHFAVPGHRCPSRWMRPDSSLLCATNNRWRSMRSRVRSRPQKLSSNAGKLGRLRTSPCPVHCRLQAVGARNYRELNKVSVFGSVANCWRSCHGHGVSNSGPARIFIRSVIAFACDQELSPQGVQARKAMVFGPSVV